MKSLIGQIDMESLVDEANKMDPTVRKLMYNQLYENINLHPILHYHGMEEAEDDKYSTLSAMKYSKGAEYITPEEISNKLHIRLKIAARILKATTPQSIC